MMKRFIISFILVCLANANTSFLFAQRVWTLEECILYAVSNNIDIRRQLIQVRNQEIKLKSSKNSRLPTVEANIGKQFSFGNYNATTGSMDGSYSEQNRDLSYTTANVSLSMPLFDGFKIKNQVKTDLFLLDAATADLEQARKDIGIQVTTQYLQVLYYKSMADVARSQVETSRKMLEQATIMVEEGKSPRSEQADAEAKVASDEAVYTDSEGQFVLARLDLAQLLNLQDVNDFNVTEENMEVQGMLLPAQEIYDRAVFTHPAILAAKAQIGAKKHALKAARSEYYPTLSFKAQLNTFHVNMFHQDLDWGGFGKQLNNNRNEVIGLHLRIPIFNALQTRGSIKRATQNLADSQLALDKERQVLFHEIQTAHYNASIAQKNLISSNKALEAATISLWYEQARFEEGNSSIFQLYQAQQQLLKSHQDLLRAKYEMIIRNRILRFYQE